MKHNSTATDSSELLRCPTCGNDDVETFTWDDTDGWADFVVCPVCGTRYNPFTGELRRPR